MSTTDTKDRILELKAARNAQRTEADRILAHLKTAKE